MQPTQETWLPVVGYEGSYEVSSEGRVRSIDRVIDCGNNIRRYKGRVLSQLVGKRGYCQVSLCRAGITSPVVVHKLVVDAFYGPMPRPGMCVRHLDGNELNNNVSNLLWGTESENAYDRVRHGTHVNTRKTHCPKGHPYDQLNTYVKPSGTGRSCRTCHRDKSRRYRANQLLTI